MSAQERARRGRAAQTPRGITTDLPAPRPAVRAAGGAPRMRNGSRSTENRRRGLVRSRDHPALPACGRGFYAGGSTRRQLNARWTNFSILRTSGLQKAPRDWRPGIDDNRLAVARSVDVSTKILGSGTLHARRTVPDTHLPCDGPRRYRSVRHSGHRRELLTRRVLRGGIHRNHAFTDNGGANAFLLARWTDGSTSA